jgi:hypothetical protein
MIKKLSVLLFIHIFLLYLSQTKPPESYSLIRGVNENINMNSGTVDLNIPLFEITEGKFKLSNSLSYESRGFVPHITPGYVGLSWNMIQFGKITREQHRIDLTTTSVLTNNAGNGGVMGYSILPGYNAYMGYDTYDCLTTKVNEDKISVFNHNVETYPKSFNPNSTTTFTSGDVSFEPDKFYFDFMGYKGYFVVDNNGKIIVFSEDSSLKVDVAKFGFHNIFENINFSEIKITDDKGNQYFFGGDVDALDINFSFNNVHYESWHPEWGQYVGAGSTKTNYIDSWLLKKIILNDGTEVNAYYQSTNLTILNNYRNNGGKGLAYPMDPQYDVHPNFPSKQNIINDNLTVELVDNYTSYTHETPIPNSYLSLYTDTHISTLTKKAVLDSIKYGNVTIDYKYDLTTNPLEISGKYLREISINRNSRLLKKVTLNYQNFGAKNQRTFLTSIKNNLGENFTMEYYNVDNFPKYIKAQANDLGFWNGDMRDYGYPPAGISGYDTPAPDDFTAFDTGLLKKVIYPTTGSVSYIYEHGTFSKKNSFILPQGVIQLVDQAGTVNAPRLLRKIETDNSQSLETSFEYKNDNGSSSGILDDSEKYQNFPGSYATSNQNLNPNLNSQNSLHYTNVKQIVNNKGYKKYLFSDRVTNPDSLTNKVFALGAYNNNFFVAQSKWYLSKNNERGKLLKEEIFDNSNNKLKETVYKYKNFLKKLPTVSLINSNCTECKVSDLNYYTKVQYYGGIHYLQTMYVPVVPYLLSSQTTREYLGNKIIETTNSTEYLDKILKRYNEGSNISEDYLWYPYPKENKLSTVSGTSIKKHLYAIDLYNENPCLSCNNNDEIVGGQYNTYQQLHYKNIFNSVLDIVKNNNNKFSLEESIFSPTTSSSGIYALKKIRKSLLNSTFDFSSYNIPASQTEDSSVFDLYDNKVNLLQKTSKSGIPTTIIWGYSQTLPIATIEGASYAQVMQAFGLNSADNNSYLQLAIVNKSNLHFDLATEADLILKLKEFSTRSELKDFKISTYTHAPLVGATSITSPSGFREHYVYDAANRLEKIEDMDNKTVKEYKYNYAPILYYNSEKSGNFTKYCGGSAIGTPFTYIVAANTYSSTISKDDADQKAQNDVNINGQNAANNNPNGICTSFTCNLSFNTSLGINGGGSVGVTSTSYYKISFGFSTGSNSVNLPWSTGVKIATISGTCRPATEYSSYNGQVYYTVKPNGEIILKTHGSALPNNTSYNYEIIFPIN